MPLRVQLHFSNAQIPLNSGHERSDTRRMPSVQPTSDLELGDSLDEREARRRKRSNAALAWREEGRSREVVGLRVDGTNYAEAVDAICGAAEAGVGGQVCVATVHTAISCRDDEVLRRAVARAELVTPDGMPLVWALRLLGVSGATRVYGPALTSVLCRRAETLGLRVGFYGGRPEVLQELLRRIAHRFPRLEVAFQMSPPFRELSPVEDELVIEGLREAGVQMLFVGLGCPKQELWMAEHRDRLPCVSIGVGAAFDFIAGAVKQSPPLLQSLGLEWLYRLTQEPLRLWRRYLIGNPRFLYHFGAQLLSTLDAELKRRFRAPATGRAKGVFE
jgi:N-acetylglucosaminyldiphosphoundecaprenol N-acetyl-beta-D-mannosaminyltransferase